MGVMENTPKFALISCKCNQSTEVTFFTHGAKDARPSYV